MSWIAAGVTLLTAGVSLYNGEEQRKAQSRALAQQVKAAKEAQLASDEANNKANARSPDIAGLLSANVLAAANGQAGTMLTGPGGIDNSKLTLGKNDLLGG